MFSQIVTYADYKDREVIAIGNKEYVDRLKKKCKQIISILIIKHNKQRREDMMSLPQEELAMVLE